ncbi:hypothetical protein TSOC_007970 [Tetrabaena socialis]|uniref:Uncharacterized protein n=1 Tax=Tetrabaena socialis TaxID=47790 RepID=A0A2J7ZZR8_9CHLO|nr:hypothetical protein TSOC_007970 [Tetrabaena socialis]|eukprot:PNH05746.1 hypothetical protein TSOC_007970 [Tetrabaena socialis]
MLSPGPSLSPSESAATETTLLQRCMGPSSTLRTLRGTAVPAPAVPSCTVPYEGPEQAGPATAAGARAPSPVRLARSGLAGRRADVCSAGNARSSSSSSSVPLHAQFRKERIEDHAEAGICPELS